MSWASTPPRSLPEEGAAKVFAFVHRIERKPKRRLRAVLESQGILPRQHITFLCDGGDTVRELGAFVHPRSEHILDWFHVAMRIEQLLQTTRGVQGPEKEVRISAHRGRHFRLIVDGVSA